MTSLEATLRNDTGKGVARKLRAAGQIPANVYGPEHEPLNVAVDPETLTRIFKDSGNRNMLVDVQVDGQAITCMVREVQRHPVSRDILHVDFYRVGDERPIVVDVPVVTTGRPAGAQLGGRIRLVRRSLKATCLPKDIPASFEVDVSPLNIGDIIMAFEVSMPDGVSLVADHDFNLVQCYGKRASGGKKKDKKQEEAE